MTQDFTKAELFSITDRYGKIERLMVQNSKGSNPFFYMELIDGRFSKTPSSRSGTIDDILAFYSRQISSYNEMLTTDKVREIYQYYIDLETDLMNRIAAYKN